MFFSKKEEPKQDKLEDLKKQLLELKAKEAELDKKSVERVQEQAVVQTQSQNVVQTSQPVQQPQQNVQYSQQQAPQMQQYQQPVAPQQMNSNYQQQNTQYYQPQQMQQPVQPVLVAGISHNQNKEATSDDNYGIILPRRSHYERPEEQAPMVVRDRDIEKYTGNVNGVVLEIGSSMSINIPIKPRMHIDEFIKIAERVKALSALNFETKY